MSPRLSCSHLREHLKQIDPERARRADTLWGSIAPKLHERQTRPDDSVGGRLHAERVEQTVWRLISESPKVAVSDFQAVEWFLLSCAACAHDFDKGLRSALPDEMIHGEGSGAFVVQHRNQLLLDRFEAIAVDRMVRVHDLKDGAFVEALQALPENYARGDGPPINLQRLAVILKAADVLQTDESRVAALAIEPERLEDKARSKHYARSSITGWYVDGARVILQAYPTSEDEQTAVNQAVDYLNEHEWRPLADSLKRYSFPHELERQIQRDYLPDERLDSAGSPREAAAPRADPTEYLQRLRNQTSFMDIRGLEVGSGKATRLPIDKLYIPLATAGTSERG
ncbi:MAG: hypothetical protein JSU86_06395, partial [Phycisphaerales bacterium]